LLLELLEDRNLLSNGQWAAYFNGLTPAPTLPDQLVAGQNLLKAAGLSDQAVAVVQAVDLSGTFIVQTPGDVTQDALAAELRTVPGFVFVQDIAVDAAHAEPHDPEEHNGEDLFNPDGLPGDGQPLPPGNPAPPGTNDVLTNNNAGGSTTSGFTHSETTTIAFGSTVLVGYNDSGEYTGTGNKFTGWSRSTDGGATFTDGGALPTNPNGDVGDPVFARDSVSGRVYYATLQFSGAGIDLFHSDDGGATWSAPAQGAPGKSGFQDKEWIAVDNYSGTGQGNVYLVDRDFGGGNGIFFYRSTNQGATFGPNGGTAIALAGATQGAFVVVAPDHSVEVFYFNGSVIQMRRSTDQGVSFGAPVTVVSGLSGGINGDLNLTGIRKGTTFASGFRSNEFPHVAVNPVSGNIYVTYDNKGSGSDKADVFLEQSTDGGATWSAPLKVNDDATTRDQWQPTIAITPDGTKLGVFYYSRQEDSADNLFKYYGRVATIAGSTLNFMPSFAVSDTASLPEFGRDSIVNSVYMGDYNTAYALPSGFYVSWSDNRFDLPGSSTQKEPDVFFKQINVGLQVVSTVPAVGSLVVGTAPTVFTVNLTDPVNPASVHASAFTVNGVAATSASYTPGSTAITFTFAVSPVTAEGVQAMHIDAGAFTRASDGSPLGVFDGTFRYATVQLAVTATEPANAAVVPLPFTDLKVHFNRPYDPATLKPGNLVLSQGTVTAATPVDDTTADYTLSGVVDEGPLSFTMPAGALTDVNGNPMLPYAGNFITQIGLAPLPAATPVLPLGSLAYQTQYPGRTGIDFAGDTDSFTINVNAGEQITVLAHPTGTTLRPTVQLFDPSGAPIGSATAPAAGQDALLQTVLANTSGTYTVTVGGAAGLGTYTVQVYLNAALEAAEHGGPLDHTPATAQNLDPAFAALPGAAGARRAAVLGGNVASGFPPIPWTDYYSITLSAGQSASVALSKLTGGFVDVLLKNAAGTTLAQGRTGPTNLSEVITNFVAPATGTYYVEATGSLTATYDVVITRNADFGTESNDSFVSTPAQYLVQNSSGQQTALGYLSATDAQDIYEVSAAEGHTLTVGTATPFAGPGDFANGLDPMVNLYGPDGSLVASDDNSAPDGRNALLTYTVPAGAGGLYFIQVQPSPLTDSPTTGEYNLMVNGGTTADAPFTVVSTSPADKAFLGFNPTTLTVTFNHNILLTSLSASALMVDGLSATGFTVVNGTTVTFTLPSLPRMLTHTVSLTDGALHLQDDSGTPLTGYSGEFYVNTVPPNVTYSSIEDASYQSDLVLAGPGGTLTYTVQFSEPLNPATVTAASFALRGLGSGRTYTASSFSYIADTSTLTINYSGLGDDSYEMRVYGDLGTGRTVPQDLFGLRLDGETNSSTWPLPPGHSGNGFQGGDFVVHFSLDNTGAIPYPTPLKPVSPLGSLVYQGDPAPSTILQAGDQDTFTLAVNAGQTVTVLVHPLGTTLQPTVQLSDPSGTGLGGATAAGAGKEVVLQTVPAGTTGTYTITVGGASGTAGGYTVQVFLNAALDAELHGGATNTTRGTAQSLDGAFLPLPKGAGRAAVLGTTDGGSGYSATAVTPTFEDISATGHATLQGTDDSVIQLTPANLGGFAFRFYGTTYTSVFYNTNALINFTTFDGSFSNTNLTSSPFEAAIAPLWTDYVTFNASSVVYWEVRGTGASQRLIIEWKNVQYYPGGGNPFITFEAVLNADGSIQFNYQGVNNAVRGTAGIKDAGTQGPNRLLLAFNNGPNTFVGNNESTLITPPPPPTADYYSFSLTGGTSAALNLKKLSSGNLTLRVEDSLGNILATGVPGPSNVDLSIANFTAPATGTYYVRVAGAAAADGGKDYNLLVTTNSAFDLEPHGSFATAQDITGRVGALGYTAAGGDPSSLFNLRGTPVSGSLVLSSPTLSIGINADGSFITNDIQTGIVFAGVEFVTPGTPLADFTIGFNGLTFTNGSAAGQGPQITVTKEDISSGTFHGVRIVGTVGGSLQLERVVAFNDGDEFATIATRLTNLTGATVNNVATLENVDPDQGSQLAGDFATDNSISMGGHLIRASYTTSAFPGGLTIGLGSADSHVVVGAGGFIINDPFQVINNPRDPGGAHEDVTINLAYNFGSLGAGQAISGVTILTLGRSIAAAETTYQNNAAGTSQADEDWYKVNAVEGQTLFFNTSTPSDGPGEFSNTLDPHIELYSPAGVLVATGTPLADGRNESISYVVPAGAAGAYRIRVIGENGTRGEYFLDPDEISAAAAVGATPSDPGIVAAVPGGLGGAGVPGLKQVLVGLLGSQGGGWTRIDAFARPGTWGEESGQGSGSDAGPARLLAALLGSTAPTDGAPAEDALSRLPDRAVEQTFEQGLGSADEFGEGLAGLAAENKE
jgi:hypothetical protein